MGMGVVATTAVALLAWSLASARLGRADITAPMALVGLGVLADVTGLVDLSADNAPLGLIAQAALALLLFSDAARVDVSRLRHDPGPPMRLLGVGLPLTIVLGTALAQVIRPSAGWSVAFLVAACLAPTDAGLGSVIVTDPAVPRRVRRTLNVESGLNDGIAAPMVSIGIALVAELDIGVSNALAVAAEELLIGALVGTGVGVCGSWAIRSCRDRGWMERDAVPLAVLALAVGAFTVTSVAGGNGFIGAFVAGLTFGPTAGRLDDHRAGGDRGAGALELTELGGELAGDVVWFLFGAAVVVPAMQGAGWQTLLYAAASLTVIRMVPVAIAMLGSGLDRTTVGFLAWFGPRGLASVVFAIEAFDELDGPGAVVLDAVVLTVLVSVVAHGATARPLANRLGRRSGSAASDTSPVAQVGPARRTSRRAAENRSRDADG